MMFCSDWHCPSLVVQNSIFRLWLHRECERRFPLRSFVPQEHSRPNFVRGWLVFIFSCVVIFSCLLLLLAGIFFS